VAESDDCLLQLVEHWQRTLTAAVTTPLLLFCHRLHATAAPLLVCRGANKQGPYESSSVDASEKMRPMTKDPWTAPLRARGAPVYVRFRGIWLAVSWHSDRALCLSLPLSLTARVVKIWSFCMRGEQN